jgi:hypothetical protein
MASSVNFAQQQYFGFDPRVLPGCGLWLDGADTQTLTSNVSGKVTQWADKSGAGANMTPVGTQSNATIQTNYQNGLSAVNFAGINVYRSVNGTGVYPSDVYIMVALKSITRMDVIAIGTTTGGGNFNSLTFAEYSARRWHNGSDFFRRTPNCVATSDETSTSLLLMNWSLSNNNFVIRRNGTQLVSTASYTYTLTAPSSIQIGFRHPELTSTTLPLNAFVGEVLAYNRQLDLAERQQVEGYLAWKWALTANLPNGHPYKRNPPAMRLFQPTDVLPCQLWLDAADGSTVSTPVTSAITQWRDKSGNGNNTTSIGAATYASNVAAFNNLNCVSNITNLAGPITASGTTQLTMIVVGSVPALSGTYWNALALNSSVKATAVANFYAAGNAFLAYYGGNPNVYGFSAGNMSLSTPITYGQPFLWIGQVSGATTNTWGYGTFYGTEPVTSATYTYSGYWVGGPDPVPAWPGNIGEIIVYGSNISAQNRQQLEGYLAWKWGLRTSLPTTHPFRNFRPATALFTPYQLSGLVLWMDPTDSTTLTLTGSSVSHWRDKSTTGAVFNNLFGPPSYSTTLINGLPGIDLTNQCGFISASTHTLTNSLTLAMILVVKSGIDAWGSFFTHGNRDLDIALERNSISAGTSLLHFQTANDNATGDIAYTIDRAELYLGTMTTGTSRFFERFGGGTTTTVTATNSSTIVTGSKTIRIGRSDGNENCDSFIGEIVYYNRVLTIFERRQLEGYLAWKWGLQASLPSTHAYAKFRP